MASLLRKILPFIAALPLVAAAQTDVDDEALDSVLQLSEVKVVAARVPYSTVIPAQKLGGKALEALNVHSVADAIRYFAGVQIKDYGGVGGVKTIDVRSMGTNHLGVFYDGIQLGNAQNGQIDLGKYSLDNIDRIELYNGQKSDIFQPARDFGSAGTVYIYTRTPQFTIDKRDNFRAIFRTGSFGVVNPSLLWEHRFNDRVSMSVNAEYTYATGRYKFRYRKMFSDGTVAWDTTATRRNGDINALRAEAALFGRIDNGRWQWKAYFYNSERGIPGAIVNNVWKNSQRQWDTNFFTQGLFRKDFSSVYSLQVKAKYARDYMHYNNPDTTLMYIDNRFWQNELYLTAANRFKILPGWEANVAVDYQWNTLDADLVNFAEPTRHTLLSAFATAFQWQGLKAQASVLGTFVSDRTVNAAGQQTNNRHYFTPAVFVSYQPVSSELFFLRAFYKRIFRMPTFNDLYYTDIGNANLRPEYATQYNIGAQYDREFDSSFLRSLGVSIDGYYNLVTDKIIAVPKGNGQYRWMMMNIGKVKIRGVDVAANAVMALPADISLRTRLTYTYQRALDYTDPSDCGDGGSYKGMIPYIPEHSGSVAASALWRNAEIDYSFIYVGERYHSSANIPANYEQPWYTHDLAASYSFRLNRCALRITLEVNNLLDQHYDVIRNYPMPGRNYKAIVKFDF